MEGKNHHVRLVAPLLVIGAVIAMAVTAGAFELKVSGSSQSVPLDSGFPQNAAKIVNPGTPVPTAAPVPYVTKNITYYTGVLDNTTNLQSGALDKLASVLNRSVKQVNLFMVPDNPPATGASGVNTSATENPVPVETLPANTTMVNITNNTTGNPEINPKINSTIIPTPVPTPSGPAPSGSGREVAGNGTISWISMKGGFYGIVADDGNQYLPGQIDPVFQVDGLRVSFLGIARPDKSDDYNWGIPLGLLELVRVGSITETRISSNGTIRYIDLENGFFGIDADNGLRYLPINLNSSFETDGLRVNFSAYPAHVSTIDMWGSPVRLITIALTGEPLDETIAMTGNVTWVNLGEGFYGIMGDDGTLYIPSQLDSQFMKNNYHVNFTAEKIRDSPEKYRLWGVPVDLLDIQKYQ